MNQPIFIGGLMKSGTSLLRKLVSLHPNIFGGLETHWFSEDFIEHWQIGNSTRHKWLKEFFEVTEEEAMLLRNQSVSSYDFFNRFMNFCTQKNNKTRWVEKTPNNVFYIDTILKEWEDAKILVMERDMKDVYASWKKNKKTTLETFLETAKNCQEIIKKHEANTDHFKIVGYKDLVSKPKETLEDVLYFVGEKYIEGLENYSGDDSDYEKVLNITGKASPTTESLKKPIFTSSLGKWETILSVEEIQCIERELG